jgi:hypothetical protein
MMELNGRRKVLVCADDVNLWGECIKEKKILQSWEQW